MNTRHGISISATAIGVLLSAGCENSRLGDDSLALGARYVADAEFRRNELVASLVNPENAYSHLRLTNYTEQGWGALPEWTPRVALVSAEDTTEPPASSSASWTTLDVDATPWNADALVDLGRRAFFRYPVQLTPYLKQAIGNASTAAHYGLGVDAGNINGAVWTELVGGGSEPAITCAACHSTVEAGVTIAGKNNAELDLGSIIADYQKGALASWGPGRVDVTDDGQDNPTGIPDLRAVRSLENLHRAATLRNGLVALAVRIETLVITSLGEVARPPRKLAFAMALYLWQIDPQPVRQADEPSNAGKALFSEHCAGCHRPPSFSGPAVLIQEVGTDPTVGISPDRWTGFYRVPSLRGVGDRRRLFASGDVWDLGELLRADRAARGHPFGVDLAPTLKAELMTYLESL